MPDGESPGAAVATPSPIPPSTGEGSEPVLRGAEIPELTTPEIQTVDTDEGESAARDGLPDEGDPTSVEANDALAQMLSTKPPPLPVEDVEMKDLAERMKVASFTVTLRALTEHELEQITDRSNKEPTKEQRKRGITKGPPDQQRMKRLIVAQGMKNPNLMDPRLIAEYGPRPEDIVVRWFLSGEIDQLCETVNDLSGFGVGAVERAKK